MSNKITIKLPNPEGVAAGGTATFRIPVGRRIHALLLKYAYNATTQNVADFTEIRLYINGQVFQRFTGTERDQSRPGAEAGDTPANAEHKTPEYQSFIDMGTGGHFHVEPEEGKGALAGNSKRDHTHHDGAAHHKRQ